MNLTGKLIQLKIILFYPDINNLDQFWHPVDCTTLQMIVLAKMRGTAGQGLLLNLQCYEAVAKAFLFVCQLEGPAWRLTMGSLASFSIFFLDVLLFSCKHNFLVTLVFRKYNFGVDNWVSTSGGRLRPLLVQISSSRYGSYTFLDSI